MGEEAPSAGEERVRRAVEGDSVALRLLLTNTTKPVRELIRRRIPRELAPVLDAEDVLQEADIEVFGRIAGFRGETTEAFTRWRCAIAVSRLRNAIRNHRAVKRGGGSDAAAKSARQALEDSTIALLDLLPAFDKTPSRWMARGELLDRVQTALEELPTRHRQAVFLVHIEGQGVREAALMMGCTDRAIHGLCRRGLQMLGERLEHARLLASRW